MAPRKHAASKAPYTLHIDRELKAAAMEKAAREDRDLAKVIVELLERYVYGGPA